MFSLFFFFFFFNDTATTEIYTLSLHDALPISAGRSVSRSATSACRSGARPWLRLSGTEADDSNTSALSVTSAAARRAGAARARDPPDHADHQRQPRGRVVRAQRRVHRR